MKSFSLISILFLCLLILIIDIFAFYWLQSITQLFESTSVQIIINVLFWVFTIGLITSIIVLKVRLDYINPSRKHLWISSFYGLTVSSFIPKLIFVIIISILYFSNHIFSVTQSKIAIPLVGLLSGFLPFFIILYGIFKAAYRFKIHHHTLSFKNLPKVFDDLRIVQISDIHIGSFNFRYHILERAIEKINHLKPDIIFITGDLVNNFSWELRGWERVFKKLTANKVKIAVLGNHDYGDYSHWNSPEERQQNFEGIKRFYKEIGFKLLLNDAITIEEDDGKFVIIGVENWSKKPFKSYGNLKKAMVKVKDIPFKILLSHDPTHWSEEVLNDTDIALTLSGHTHGMQAAFQYKKLKWSPIKFKYKHWAGLYSKNKQFLYVNRGLGWLGFPGRIGMRPEITLMELRSF